MPKRKLSAYTGLILVAIGLLLFFNPTFLTGTLNYAGLGSIVGVESYQVAPSGGGVICGLTQTNDPAGYLFGEEVRIENNGFFDSHCFGQDLVSGFMEAHGQIAWQSKDFFGLIDNGAWLFTSRCQQPASASSSGNWDCEAKNVEPSCQYLGLYDTLKEEVVGFVDIPNAQKGARTKILDLDGSAFSQSWGTYALTCLDSAKNQASTDLGKTFQVFQSTSLCSIPSGYTLITQDFGAGETISMDSLRVTPDAFCLEAPVLKLDSSENVLEQTVQPIKDMVEGKSTLIPSGQIWRVSYVSQVPADIGVLCGADSALNPITGECVPSPAFTYYCARGTWDSISMSCVIQPESITLCEEEGAVYVAQENKCLKFISEAEVTCEGTKVFSPSTNKCVSIIAPAVETCSSGQVLFESKCFNPLEKVFDNDSQAFVCPDQTLEQGEQCLSFVKNAELFCSEGAILGTNCVDLTVSTEFICPAGTEKTETGCIKVVNPEVVNVCEKGSYDETSGVCVYAPAIESGLFGQAINTTLVIIIIALMGIGAIIYIKRRK